MISIGTEQDPNTSHCKKAKLDLCGCFACRALAALYGRLGWEYTDSIHGAKTRNELATDPALELGGAQRHFALLALLNVDEQAR